MLFRKPAPMSANELRSILHYDQATGKFTWLCQIGKRVKIGSIAGWINNHNRRFIQLNGKGYAASRLAWLYMTDEWPDEDIDHIDRDPTNDKWPNLRRATRSQNCINKKDAKRDLPRGVYRCTDGVRFWAVIKAKGKRNYLGSYDTVEAARSAYLAAAEVRGEIQP